uniref:Uncharacterized protein n=1 Tax=Amphimedon queenslandica TaxID=400682 RepID=A0A1X7U2W5_AMPQE
MGNAQSEKLYSYCRTGNVEKVNQILNSARPQHHFDVDWKHPGKHYRSPLIVASKKGHKEVVISLLDKKASTGQRDFFGWNALDYAAYKGHNEVAEILTRDGNWVSNGRTSYYNESSLHIATRCLNVEIAEVLLKRGGTALIDATTSGRKTALHYAVAKRNIELVRLLLKHNASIYIRNMDRQTPLQLARSKNFKDAVQLMDKVRNAPGSFETTSNDHEDIEDNDAVVTDSIRGHSESKIDSVSIFSEAIEVQCSIKCIVSGPPMSGKTVFTNRVKGEIVNITKTNGSPRPHAKKLMTRQKSFVIPFARLSSIASLGSENSSDDDGQPPNSPPYTPQDSFKSTASKYFDDTENLYQLPDRISYDPRSLHIFNVGSQPELIPALPLILRGPALYFVFFDVSCELTKEIVVRGDDGYTMHYSTIQYLHQTLSSYYEIGREDGCKAILIATHIDHIGRDNMQKVLKKKDKELRKYFGKADFVNDDFIVTDPKNSYLFFPIDNMNGDDAELKHVVKFIEDILSKSFKPMQMSYDVARFLNKIEQKYSKTEAGICHYDEAIKVARECNISKGDLPQVLEFLHRNVGTLLYFEEVDGLNEFVICNPDALFFSLNRFIRSIGNNGAIRLSGEVPASLLDGTTIQECTLPISERHIISLLMHLNLFMELPLNSDIYFSSNILLPDTNIILPTEEEVHTIQNSPLLIQFEGCYVPSRLFNALIVKLAQKWKLRTPGRSSNSVCFITEYGDAIRLLSRFSHMEIPYSVKFSWVKIFVISYIFAFK